MLTSSPVLTLVSMLSVETLNVATNELLGAALVGEQWDSALQALATAAGARDVALLRVRNHKLADGRSSPGFVNQLEACLNGQAPPNSRRIRVTANPKPGFCIDQDHYSAEELSGDPYYQEFLRPQGLFWHASARLAAYATDELWIGFKRELRSGSYEREDIRTLDQALINIKAAVRCARGLLDAETKGAVRLLHHRGDPVFEFDERGHVRHTHGFVDHPGQPVHVVGGRLVARDRRFAERLEHAVAAATGFPPRTALIALSSATGGWSFLQLVPLQGVARDFFRSSVAVGVLIAGTTQKAQADLASLVTHDIFGLTERELQVAALLSKGLSIIDIAEVMNIKPGTARIHLKRVFEKSGTRRQAELVSLLSRLLM